MTIAVGFFDGVHRGHRRILEGADKALTFFNHPLDVLAPERAPRRLMTYEQRVGAIMALGVREVITLHFTPELASLSPEEFARRYFTGMTVRCGDNWRFGRRGEGSAEWLRSHGYAVEVVPAAEHGGRIISSTRIREAVAAGEIACAEAMLGHPLAVVGVPFAGKGEGARLGYPTINLRLGVYAAELGGERAVANFGHAPTFGERSWQDPVLEVHLLKFLRPERKFASAEELRRQIAEDCTRAMK